MRRAVLLLSAAVFLATAALVPDAVFELRDVVVHAEPEIEVPLDVLGPIDAGLAGLAEARKRPHGAQIAFLGDSMVVEYGEGRTVPERLQQSLDAKTGEGRFDVHTLAAPGMGPFDFYFIADRVASANPDQVILPINFASFSTAWRYTFSRPQLAALLSPRRLPEAFGLPLDRIGLTADRLLLYFSIGQAGELERFHELTREQALLGTARRAFSSRLSKRWAGNAEERFAVGAVRYFRRLWNIEGTQRFTAAGTLQRFGVVLDGIDVDNPTLQALEATIRTFRRYDVDVLVYTNPTNVEHMELVGVLDEHGRSGLARSLASMREVSTRAGARFVDLHALLPDDGFRDAAGHFNVKEDGTDGPAHLAGGLAPFLYLEAQKRSRLR